MSVVTPSKISVSRSDFSLRLCFWRETSPPLFFIFHLRTRSAVPPLRYNTHFVPDIALFLFHIIISSDIISIMTTEDEAKQLDSVTDRVQEKELDESRATQALGALSTNTTTTSSTTSGLAAASTSSINTIHVKKEDVDIIMEELEVTEDEAMAALRAELGVDANLEGQELVAAALRRLVTS